MKYIVIIPLLTLLTTACSQKDAWEAPSVGLINNGNASLFYIVPKGIPGVTLFHLGDLNTSGAHSSNTKAKTFNYSGTLSIEGKTPVTYDYKSVNIGEITIGKDSYELSEGRVFLIGVDESIIQLPFAPLEPTDDYVAQLQEYINANKVAHPSR